MGFRAFLVMDNKVARQEMAENGGKWQKMAENGLPRLFGRKWISACFPSWPSRWPGRKWQEMAGNGRKWQKMGCRGYLVGNGFSRVSRRGHRGDQEDHGKNGRKWQKMVEKSSPRLFGRKWIFAHLSPFPYY